MFWFIVLYQIYSMLWNLLPITFKWNLLSWYWFFLCCGKSAMQKLGQISMHCSKNSIELLQNSNKTKWTFTFHSSFLEKFEMINDLQFPTYLSDNGRISHSSPSGFSIFSLPTIHFSTHRLIPLSTTLLPNLKCVAFKVMCLYHKYIFYFAGITPDNILTEYFHLVALLPRRTQPDIVEVTSIAAPAITEK